MYSKEAGGPARAWRSRCRQVLAYLTAPNAVRAIVQRIGRIEGVWRERAGAQGRRRAAEGGRPSSAPGGGRSRAAPWGTGLRRPPCHEERGRGLALLAGAARASTPRARGGRAPGPASPLPWPGPGAPQSLALPSPLAASSASSAPCWPLPQASRLPLPHLLEGPEMAAVWRLQRRRRGTS